MSKQMNQKIKKMEKDIKYLKKDLAIVRDALVVKIDSDEKERKKNEILENFKNDPKNYFELIECIKNEVNNLKFNNNIEFLDYISNYEKSIQEHIMVIFRNKHTIPVEMVDKFIKNEISLTDLYKFENNKESLIDSTVESLKKEKNFIIINDFLSVYELKINSSLEEILKFYFNRNNSRFFEKNSNDNYIKQLVNLYIVCEHGLRIISFYAICNQQTDTKYYYEISEYKFDNLNKLISMYDFYKKEINSESDAMKVIRKFVNNDNNEKDYFTLYDLVEINNEKTILKYNSILSVFVGLHYNDEKYVQFYHIFNNITTGTKQLDISIEYNNKDNRIIPYNIYKLNINLSVILNDYKFIGNSHAFKMNNKVFNEQFLFMINRLYSLIDFYNILPTKIIPKFDSKIKYSDHISSIIRKNIKHVIINDFIDNKHIIKYDTSLNRLKEFYICRNNTVFFDSNLKPKQLVNFYITYEHGFKVISFYTKKVETDNQIWYDITEFKYDETNKNIIEYKSESNYISKSSLIMNIIKKYKYDSVENSEILFKLISYCDLDKKLNEDDPIEIFIGLHYSYKMRHVKFYKLFVNYKNRYELSVSLQYNNKDMRIVPKDYRKIIFNESFILSDPEYSYDLNLTTFYDNLFYDIINNMKYLIVSLIDHYNFLIIKNIPNYEKPLIPIYGITKEDQINIKTLYKDFDDILYKFTFIQFPYIYLDSLPSEFVSKIKYETTTTDTTDNKKKKNKKQKKNKK